MDKVCSDTELSVTAEFSMVPIVRQMASEALMFRKLREQVIQTLEGMGVPHFMVSGQPTLEALAELLKAAKR